jgi:hypothetical protein
LIFAATALGIFLFVAFPREETSFAGSFTLYVPRGVSQVWVTVEQAANGYVVYDLSVAPFSPAPNACWPYVLILSGDAKIDYTVNSTISKYILPPDTPVGSSSTGPAGSNAKLDKWQHPQIIQGRMCYTDTTEQMAKYFGQPIDAFYAVVGRPSRPLEETTWRSSSYTGPKMYPARAVDDQELNNPDELVLNRFPTYVDLTPGQPTSTLALDLGDAPAMTRIEYASPGLSTNGRLHWESEHELAPLAVLTSLTGERVANFALFISGALLGVASGLIPLGLQLRMDRSDKK